MTMMSLPSLKTNSPNIGKFSMVSLSGFKNMIFFAIWLFFGWEDFISIPMFFSLPG